MPYNLQVDLGVIKISSLSSAAEKGTISLTNVHGRTLPKVQVGEEHFAKSSPKGREESKGAVRGSGSNRFVYPLKIMLSRTNSRTLYFETRLQRDQLQNAILRQ